MNTIFLLRSTGMITCALFTTSAFAVYDSSQAISLLKNQKFDAAYQYLSTELNLQTTGQQDLFLFGMAAKQSKHYNEAIKAFQTMLAREPDITRVQLELIDAYQLSGNLKAAKDLTNELLASDRLDDRSRVELEKFSRFAANPRNKNSNFRLSIYGGLGYVYDSNVNSGPDVDKVSIFNLPFTLSSDAKKVSDSGIEANAGIQFQNAFSQKNFLYGGASVNHTNYFNQNDFDKTVVSGQLGYGQQFGGNWLLRAPLSISYTRYGEDKPLEYIDYGFTPNLSYYINPQTEIGAFAGVTQRTFKEGANKDTYRVGLNGSWQHEQHGLYGNLSFSTEDTDRKSSEADRFNVTGNYHYQINDRLNFSAGGGIEVAKFHGKSPLFGKTRQETGYDLNAGVTYRLPFLETDFNANVSHHINTGNLDYYEYDKTTVNIGLQKTFNP